MYHIAKPKMWSIFLHLQLSGLLIFGNLFQLWGKSGKDTYQNAAKMVAKYGVNGVGTIYFANRPFVFVSDYETIKKVLNADEFTGRPLSVVRDEFFGRKGKTGKFRWRVSSWYFLWPVTCCVFFHSVDWLIDWLIDWLDISIFFCRKIHRSIDWLIDWIFPSFFLS